MAAEMRVEQLALVPYSFPTYANALGRAAIGAALALDETRSWAADHLADAEQVALASGATWRDVQPAIEA
jgi:hypothetical protein